MQVRTLFLRAAASAPCVVFFDELDALCPKRGGEGGVNSERVVCVCIIELCVYSVPAASKTCQKLVKNSERVVS